VGNANAIDRLLLDKLPKTDLHVHFDGSVLPQTLLELADRQGIALPVRDAEGLRPYMQVEGDCRSLDDYLSKFVFVLRVLQTAEALERTTYEVIRQAAAHNCRYIEVRIGTNQHLQGGLSLDEAHEAFLHGMHRGAAEFGVKARGVAICLRHHPVPDNIAVIESAARFRGRGLAAVDLAGPEAGFPPALHRAVFERARELGMPATIHAGEAAGPESVRDAVELLGAVRIGHGVRIREDAAVFDMIRERGIPLEMCPVSNLQTKAAPDWTSYPIRDYVDKGIKVTVNTDNMTVSGTTITNEFAMLAEQFGFSAAEIGRLVLNGVDAAFLEPSEKAELRADCLRQFAALGVGI